MDNLKPRRQALLDFIMVHMMSNAGRAPTYTEILAAKVGRFTKAGPITSNSVIRYNLQKLEDAGLIRLLINRKSRVIEIPNATFGIPWNRIHSIGLEKYKNRIVAIDSFGIGGLADNAIKIIREWDLDENVQVWSMSQKPADWRDHDFTWEHLKTDYAHQALLIILLSWGASHRDCAVITDDYWDRLAAIGCGMAVFGIDEVLNGTA